MKKTNATEQEFRLSFQSNSSLIEFLSHYQDNPNFDWSFFSKKMSGDEDLIIQIISSFQDRIDFPNFTRNTNFKWSENMIFKYAEKINWTALSLNTNIHLTNNLLETFKTKWFWGHDYGSRKYTYYNSKSLSSNPCFPLDVFIIEKYSEYIDWRGLGLNPSLKVYNPVWEYCDEDEFEIVERNIHLLKHFKKYWEFERSTFCDDNAVISGVERTSIFDNKSINWKKSELRVFFEDEINKFNLKYNESI
jgi:hypothetical protein